MKTLENSSRRKLLAIFMALFCLVPIMAHATAATVEEQRAAIQKMEDETLARLYKERPEARKEVQDALGYAVFSSGSLALVWVSGSYGHGVAHNNTSNTDIYMQMASAGVGLGIGAKDYNTVFIFYDQKALDDFVTTGLDLSGTADAAAQVGAKGDSLSEGANILPGMRIYQMTDSGLIAQAMVQGTKYWRDEELNK
jgi:lipid-binding SYLF domain-containing protein